MNYSKQFNKHRTEHFARLIQSIDLKSLKSQEDYEKTIENVYMTMFRHNIQGQFVYENPNPNAPEDESWLVKPMMMTIEKKFLTLYTIGCNIII